MLCVLVAVVSIALLAHTIADYDPVPITNSVANVAIVMSLVGIKDRPYAAASLVWTGYVASLALFGAMNVVDPFRSAVFITLLGALAALVRWVWTFGPGHAE